MRKFPTHSLRTLILAVWVSTFFALADAVAASRARCGDTSVLAFTPYTLLSMGKYQIGVKIGDLDGDRRNDIVAINRTEGTVSIRYNLGERRFAVRQVLQQLSPYPASSIVVGDIDNDGDMDIVLYVPFVGYGQLIGFINKGDRIFQRAILGSAGIPVSSSSGPISMELADLDGDGRLDLVLTDGGGIRDRLAVARNSGNLEFIPWHLFELSSRPWIVRVEDLNLDGWKDIVIGSYEGQNFQIFSNKGGGVLKQEVTISADGNGTYGFGISDLDGDGYKDLVIRTSATSGIQVYYGASEFRFSARTYPVNGMPIYTFEMDVVDIDSDGVLDVVGLSSSPERRFIVVRGLGAREFSSAAGRFLVTSPDFGNSLNTMAIGDLDNDRRVDVAVGTNILSGSNGYLSLIWNESMARCD